MYSLRHHNARILQQAPPLFRNHRRAVDTLLPPHSKPFISLTFLIPLLLGIHTLRLFSPHFPGHSLTSSSGVSVSTLATTAQSPSTQSPATTVTCLQSLHFSFCWPCLTKLVGL